MKFLIKSLLAGLSLFMAASAFAAEVRHDCGEYSFVVPQGFTVREVALDGNTYRKNLLLNDPYSQSDLSGAVIYCIRERKTEFQTFSLPQKSKLEFQTGPRRGAEMLITATENVRHDNMWLKFSLLEERTANTREIRGKERFMVAVEMDASTDDWHTMLFISDFRRFESFLDTDEYKSMVTGSATQVMDSIRKVTP